MNIDDVTREFYDYSLYIRGYSPYTIKRYKTAIEHYCSYAHVTSIEQVTDENVRALFYYGRTQKQWKPSTFIINHVSLLVFFRWCVANNYLSHNPILQIEKPKLQKKLPPKLTKQEALCLLETSLTHPYYDRFLQYRNHAIFSTLVFAGLRKKELLNLKLADVDLENHTLFVNQGKGSKDRIIPISEKLQGILKTYLRERKRLKKTCDDFFISLHRNSGFTDSGLKRLVVTMRRASKLPFTIHKLRHTFATLMLEGGCDIYSLSRMMGHSDIKTTTIYLAASAEHLKRQMSKHPLNL